MSKHIVKEEMELNVAPNFDKWARIPVGTEVEIVDLGAVLQVTVIATGQHLWATRSAWFLKMFDPVVTL